MPTVTMSVTRALVELKTIAKRIIDEIDSAPFVNIIQGKSDKVSRTTIGPDDFGKNAKARFEKITSLINRRNRIKSAILANNSNVKVRIAGKEMTIIEAIDMKGSIEFKKSLLEKLRKQHADAISLVEKYNANADTKVQAALGQFFTGDKKGKIETSSIESITKPIQDQEYFRVVDPIGALDRIAELSAEINAFTSEVDYALSEANAKHEVMIED